MRSRGTPVRPGDIRSSDRLRNLGTEIRVAEKSAQARPRLAIGIQLDAPVGRLSGDVAYRNVGFGYKPGQSVLTDIDFHIRAGETVAFVGSSGAGKTTICALLPRFYEIASGSITIDGMDIRDMTLKSLRLNIGIVQQDVFLFAGTIREIIAYGR